MINILQSKMKIKSGPSQVISAHGSKGWVRSKKLPISYERIGLVAALFDVVIVFGLGVASGISYHAAAFGQVDHLRNAIGAGLTCGILFCLGMQSMHLYRPSAILFQQNILRSVLATWTAVFCSLLAMAFLAKISWEFSRGAAICFFLSGCVALPLSRRGARHFAQFLISNNFLSERRNIVLVGDRRHLLSRGLSENLMRHGFNVVHQVIVGVTDDNKLKNVTEVSASIESLKQLIRETRVDEIFLAFDTGAQRTIDVVASSLHAVPVPVRLLLDPHFSKLLSRTINDFGAAKAIKLQSGPLTEAQQFVKRGFDVVLSFLGLLALSPIFLLVGCAIKLDTPGPMLFRQRRAGFGGRVFTIYKFRSMSTLDDGAVVKQATRNDKRVTRVGWWLRKTSVDELPQLLNVLKGDMSLVGPRPHALSHDNEYDKLIATYALRQHMKPGITGWAQANGFRGETSSLSMMEARVEHDIWYIGHWSLKLDIKAIALTVLQIIKPKNVY